MPLDAIGHKTKAFDCGTIIPTLPNTIFYSHIYPLMCKGREDEALLNDICKYRKVCKSWKVATSANFVWHVFHVSKVDVRASHWPNVEDIDVRLLTYKI
jgi:hypothetical protein